MIMIIIVIIIISILKLSFLFGMTNLCAYLFYFQLMYWCLTYNKQVLVTDLDFGSFVNIIAN